MRRAQLFPILGLVWEKSQPLAGRGANGRVTEEALCARLQMKGSSFSMKWSSERHRSKTSQGGEQSARPVD